MSEKNEAKTNKIITAVLAIIIIIAAIAILYVNLPKETQNDNNENTGETSEQSNESVTALTVMIGEEQMNYTLEELESLEAFSGSGSYIKTGWLPTVVIEGPFNYTGVSITTLLNQLEDLPENYTITVEASDGYTNDYNMSYIAGNIPYYNETGNITGTGGVTLLLAYMQENTYINETLGGPIRIVCVDDGAITASGLWVKYIVSIEIKEA
jgi:hypothetical protein